MPPSSRPYPVEEIARWFLITCRICGNEEDNTAHTAKEVRFGTWEEFEYVECASCGTVQIAEIPADLSRHYPSDYYSYRSRGRAAGDGWRAAVSRLRAKLFLGGGLLGGIYRSLFREPSRYRWIRRAGVDFGGKILDVGCGSGGVLLKLRMDGFTDLTGIDKFLGEGLEREERVKLIRGELAELESTYDFILVNHTFEHVEDPAGFLIHVREHLAPEGVALFRIPLAGTFAWREYGTDWIQLDAPRHLHLLTVKAMERLAEGAGLSVDEVVFDSRSLQFWGSEQARRGIALTAENSEGENPERSVFHRAEIVEFNRRAEGLNRNRDGDQACFYLKRVR